MTKRQQDIADELALQIHKNETRRANYKIRQKLAELPEHHEINGHLITTEFICNFGCMSRCSRHKAHIDGKAIGWYEEGPSKSFLESNWAVWTVDSVYFKDKFKTENGENHQFEMAELPYSDPPLYSPICETPEEFLSIAKVYKLV